MNTRKRTVGDIEGFIDMLRAACEDKAINSTLQHLLSLPDKKRKVMIQMLVSDMMKQKAPQELIEAISCLVDDSVAEKAYSVIYKCRR